MEKVESWRRHYDGERPNSAPGNLTTREFAVLADIGDQPAKLALRLVQEMAQDQIMSLNFHEHPSQMNIRPDPPCLATCCL